MTTAYELTEHEAIALEAVQALGTAYVMDVVTYAWTEHQQRWPREKAARLLSRLARMGKIMRQPRAAIGWGRGWQPSQYTSKD